MNMTKVGLIGLVCLLFLGIFSMALAREAKPEMTVPSSTPIEYILPYPGILPDHPLYVFKIFRDWLLLVLITSPERKVEFELLTAEKRLNMGLSLVGNHKKELALKTFTDGIHILGEGENQLRNVNKNQPGVVANLKERYKKSLLKHIESVTQIRTQFSQNEVSKIDLLLKKLTELQTNLSL